MRKLERLYELVVEIERWVEEEGEIYLPVWAVCGLRQRVQEARKLVEEFRAGLWSKIKRGRHDEGSHA